MITSQTLDIASNKLTDRAWTLSKAGISEVVYTQPQFSGDTSVEHCLETVGALIVGMKRVLLNIRDSIKHVWLLITEG